MRKKNYFSVVNLVTLALLTALAVVLSRFLSIQTPATKIGFSFLPIALSGVLFMVSFLAAGLDFRFGWTHVPGWLVWAAAAVQLGSYGLYAEVLRENAYLSRTVEVQEGQTVIDTGLYGIVRHPMYTATIFLCLAIGLVLGSWISFVLMLVYPVLILFRIRGEEALLEENLPGYRDYKAKVRWRLIPFLW